MSPKVAETVMPTHCAESTGQYEFVRYEPGYKAEVLGLFAEVWPPDREMNSAYFDWKYCRNPYANGSLIYLALHRGEVVSVFGWFPGLYRAGDQELRYLCVAGSDAVTRSDHRRRGLHDVLKSTAVRELEAEPYEFEISMSNNEYSKGSALKWGTVVGELAIMQWRPNCDAGRVRRVVRILPLLSTIRRRLEEDGRAQQPSGEAVRPFQALDRSYERTNHFGRSNVALEEKSRPGEMASLVSLHGRSGRIEQVRNEPFYAWRYDNPFSVYRFLFWERRGLHGYLVLRQPFHGRSDAAFIVDWEADGIGIIRELLDIVIRYGGFGSIDIWSMGMAGDMTKVLTRCGFRPTGGTASSERSRFHPSIVARPFHRADKWSVAGRDLRDISNWDLRPIYSDAF